MRKVVLTTVFALLIMGATLPAYAGDGSLIGAGIGGAIGGLFGSQVGRGSGQFFATTLGVGAGAVVGSAVGQSFDNANRTSYATRPDYGYYDAVEPVFYNSYAPNYVAPPAPPPTYIDPSAGTYCRPFSQQIVVDGRVQESYGTACLQPDGAWRIVQ